MYFSYKTLQSPKVESTLLVVLKKLIVSFEIESLIGVVCNGVLQANEKTPLTALSTQRDKPA